MKPLLVEGREEVDIGKVMSNHYKSGFCFLYPYFFNLVLLLHLN